MRYPPSIVYGFAILAVLGVFAAVLNFSNWPGHAAPSYHARDHDPQLERDAAKAKPLIDALEGFHAKNAAYPAGAGELAPLLTGTTQPPVAPKGGAVNGWRYVRNTDGKGYQLAFKLGGAPELLYEFDGARAMWVFSPGNGNANKEILLGE